MNNKTITLFKTGYLNHKKFLKEDKIINFIKPLSFILKFLRVGVIFEKEYEAILYDFVGLETEMLNELDFRIKILLYTKNSKPKDLRVVYINEYKNSIVYLRKIKTKNGRFIYSLLTVSLQYPYNLRLKYNSSSNRLEEFFKQPTMRTIGAEDDYQLDSWHIGEELYSKPPERSVIWTDIRKAKDAILKFEDETEIYISFSESYVMTETDYAPYDVEFYGLREAEHISPMMGAVAKIILEKNMHLPVNNRYLGVSEDELFHKFIYRHEGTLDSDEDSNNVSHEKEKNGFQYTIVYYLVGSKNPLLKDITNRKKTPNHW